MNEKIKKFADDIWKKEFDKFIVNDIVDRYIKTLQQELDQYKNNWEELKKWIELKKEQYATNIEWLSVERMSNVLNKMKELEEDK